VIAEKDAIGMPEVSTRKQRSFLASPEKQNPGYRIFINKYGDFSILLFLDGTKLPFLNAVAHIPEGGDRKPR
jgi:hypothetical protein